MRMQTSRANMVRAGVRVEIFTVLWMVVEAVVSIAAGVLAHSTDGGGLKMSPRSLFLFWLLGETREALEEAREEHVDDDSP